MEGGSDIGYHVGKQHGLKIKMFLLGTFQQKGHWHVTWREPKGFENSRIDES